MLIYILKSLYYLYQTLFLWPVYIIIIKVDNCYSALVIQTVCILTFTFVTEAMIGTYCWSWRVYYITTCLFLPWSLCWLYFINLFCTFLSPVLAKKFSESVSSPIYPTCWRTTMTSVCGEWCPKCGWVVL